MTARPGLVLEFTLRSTPAKVAAAGGGECGRSL